MDSTGAALIIGSLLIGLGLFTVGFILGFLLRGYT